MVATKPPDLNRKYSEQELDYENEPFSKKTVHEDDRSVDREGSDRKEVMRGCGYGITIPTHPTV